MWSWRCVGRKHQAAHPMRVSKSNVGDLMRLRKSGQGRHNFPCTFEAQTQQGNKAKSERGRALLKRQGQGLQEGCQKSLARRDRPEVLREVLPGSARRGDEQRAGEGCGGKGSRSAGQGRRREAGQVRRSGRQGRSRPGGGARGSPPALAGEEAAAPGAAPSLPASPAGPRAAVGEAGRPPPAPRRAGLPLTCLEVEGDAGLGEVGGVALGADAADGSAVDVLLGRCRH